MKSMLKKTTLREIKSSLGRYIAILAIVALGVGFFSGLKMTKPYMINTADTYLKDMNLYDLRLLSSLGFVQEDVDSFSNEENVKYAEGSHSYDVLCTGLSKNETVLKTHSMPKNINGIVLKEGRMPENSSECVADSRLVSKEQLGTVIKLTDSNEEYTLNVFSEREYTIVGTVDSSYYMNFERGTTSLGNGRVSGFVYMLPDTFSSDYYTEVFIKFTDNYKIYSKKYDDYIEQMAEKWEDICKSRKPDYYILGRNTNIGYVCFENDSNIVEGIADVFPLFFFMVAALVCITTMNRMVEEQRTQIGVLKALGYSKLSIMGKFMFYSGSAALIGCVAGYLGGTRIFPAVIWKVYGIMYSMPKLIYTFNVNLAVIMIIVSLFCNIGATWFSCRYELSETAAALMRPKSPKAGKRIFLEKITFVWKRLKFLQKVSARNILRYKKRFFMMVIGISGCTALLVTGFGIKDSITGIASRQFDEIQISDGTISLKNSTDTKSETPLTKELSSLTDDYAFASEESWDILYGSKIKSVNMVIMENPGEIKNYLNLHTVNDQPIEYPKKDNAIISHKIADTYGISVGDDIIIRNSDMQEITVTISGIFENFVYNYVYISPETYTSAMGKEPEYQTVYVNYKNNLDVHKCAANLMKLDEVSAVTVNQDIRKRFDSMMSSLNYIVLLIIICAAALAFIVLYNLTNINITERIREIATIKVLGFYRNETSSYVFRENMVLTAIGAGIGLIPGYFLHNFIMLRINVDMVAFDIRILPASYLYSIILTFIFNFMVNTVMSFKLEGINMAESLKSVD